MAQNDDEETLRTVAALAVSALVEIAKGGPESDRIHATKTLIEIDQFLGVDPEPFRIVLDVLEDRNRP